jgi:DNA-binding transcriptional LysR family regulator
MSRPLWSIAWTRLLARLRRRVCSSIPISEQSTGNLPTLTAEGERYAQACRRLLTDVDDLESSLLDDQVQPQGTVRMTAPVLFGTRYVAPAITQLLQDNPRIEVQLTLADQITNLTEDGFNLALRIGALADSTLIAAPLGMIRRVVCAHPRLASLHPVLCPEDLSAMPCVNFQRETDLGTWQFQRSG